MKTKRIVYFLIFTLAAVFYWQCRENENIGEEKKMTQILRQGSLIGLKNEYEERYIILHKHVFPGVLHRLRKCNIHNYSIFLRDGILFSYFEYTGSDYAADMAAMADEETKDWWKLTDPMQRPLENRKEGEWWASMELLYRMDKNKVSGKRAKRFAYTGSLQKGNVQKFKSALQQIDSDLVNMILMANLQNLSFYVKENQVYFYYEYVGDYLKLDMKRLEAGDSFKKLNARLSQLMKPVSDDQQHRTWQEMKEVFHTE